jgi:hypothetical protein
MNHLVSTALFSAILALGTSAQAQDKTKSEPSGQEKPGGNMAKPAATPAMGTMGAKPMARSIDTNGDGLVSKAEFTKHADAVWAALKKDAKGMATIADVDASLAAK